jgi:hypothetical protein
VLERAKTFHASDRAAIVIDELPSAIFFSHKLQFIQYSLKQEEWENALSTP